MNILFLNWSSKSSGATQEILKILHHAAPENARSELVCLGDLEIGYCRGCKACYTAGECIVKDGMQPLMKKLEAADAVVIAAPSYWADIPGIAKSFIDRCTPWGDTNPYPDRPRLSPGKKCFGIALRTGTRPMECEHILQTIRHWCGHMEIELADSCYFCQIEDKKDIEPHRALLEEKARLWFSQIK